jgi:hypothetical protein
MTAYATSAEYATYRGSANVTCTATTTVLAGAVNTITIGAGGGYGYLTSPSVVIAAPTTGVRATATATVANGVVTLLTLTGAGSGYGATAPAVTIAPPEDLDRLLLRASELLDDYLRTALYDTDDDGFPTDTDIIEVFRDACCAQVEYWQVGDEEDDIAGPVQGLALGGMQVQYGAGDNRTSPMYLAPRAARLLRNAGLYSGQPVVV